jgi:hypothetical protein
MGGPIRPGSILPIPMKGMQMTIATRKARRITPIDSSFPQKGAVAILSKVDSLYSFCADEVTPSSIFPIHSNFAPLSSLTLSDVESSWCSFFTSGAEEMMFGCASSCASSFLSSP